MNIDVGRLLWDTHFDWVAASAVVAFPATRVAILGSTGDVKTPHGNTCAYYFGVPQLHGTAATSKVRRRRGEAFERALYEATLAELAVVGYERLTMEGIAARAQTGKSALYRRWSGKHDLVRAALVFALPPLPRLRYGRSARRNLLTMLTSWRDLLAGKTDFPGVDIIQQLLHETELRSIFASAVVRPRLEIIASILRATVADGDVDSDRLTSLSAHIRPALINQHFLLNGKPPNRRELELIADVVLPKLSPRPGDK